MTALKSSGSHNGRLFGWSGAAFSAFFVSVFAAFFAAFFVAGPSVADPMTDICDSRARSESGYRAPLEYQSRNGRSRVRLSGSVALGASSSRGAASPGGATPPFAGAPSSDRHEQDRLDKQAARYQRIFDSCMGGR